MPRAASEGHYAKEQILCKDRLIYGSRRGRFPVALGSARACGPGERALDYGRGDGPSPAMLTGEPGEGVPRVAVVCDLREEGWHSMNLVADMLLEGLCAEHAGAVAATRVCPPMRRRLSRAGAAAGPLFNADRLLNRFWDYPRHAGRLARRFDLFHVVDHSYAQLVHRLPPRRTVVTCHDLDTFRCLLDPEGEPRPAAFRAMARRVLSGFRRAARVACDSRATRDELLAHGLFAPENLAVIPNGVHPAFNVADDPAAGREAERLLGPADAGAVELLHVGSTIPRKRVDVLLEVFARVRARHPRARLVRVGGDFTAAQAARAGRLGLGGAVVVLPHLDPRVLAAVYRRAALVLLPSEREGFGLPVVEALACRAHVVASDLAVLREVGGGAATFCPVGDLDAWAATVLRLVGERGEGREAWAARLAAGPRHASRFTWRAYAAGVVELYREVLCESAS
ncbi:MAG TPA: glycosyltransferase family 1 protein [Pyrinomonadaceae bacterium]